MTVAHLTNIGSVEDEIMRTELWTQYDYAFRIWTLFVAVSILVVSSGAQMPDRTAPTPPEFLIERTRGDLERDGLEKLTPELLALYEQYSLTQRGGAMFDESTEYTSSQLASFFGIVTPERDPMVVASVVFAKAIDLSVLANGNATLLGRSENVAFVALPVRSVDTIAVSPLVTRIGVLKSFQTPEPLYDAEKISILPRERSASSQNPVRLANEFNKQQLTGKGVFVGVIDSGIDWKHDDFRKGDGTSRIHSIWDLTDDSYQKSGGKIGSAPPVYFEKTKTWLGTVYTNKQINEALAGRSVVNSIDRNGHGTAVAGTAASNGRATARGVPQGTYAGVATEADLIVVRVSDCLGFHPASAITAEWILETAKAERKPAVINMSFGTRFSLRDGTDEHETFLDSIVGPSKRGAVITVAAGNDSRFNLRAGGRFAPKRPGQADQFSDPIELNVKSAKRILAIFDKADDWGIAFRSTNPIFQDANGDPVAVFLVKNNKRVEFETVPAVRDRSAVDKFFASIRPSFAGIHGENDTAQIQFPAGNYVLWGFGTTANVTNGRFDFYIVDAGGSGASFGTGTLKTEMVTSPGNAKNVITVGSYDFRDRWINSDGETTFFNLDLGSVSPYSNPGFRRDGVVKPDIVAPGRYTISSLSQSAAPDSGGCKDSMAAENETSITRDGFHIAWDGTSASTPFVTGVIALMLQKNPNLDSEQVRSILQKTARTGGKVGAVPNPVWGWGMLDPEAVLRGTPAPRSAGPSRTRSRP